MPIIKSVFSREILDSRGNPTIETSVWADTGHGAISSIASGASTGKYEAVELRDGDKLRYGGLGVTKAVSNVNDIIANAIIGQEVTSQNNIDQILLNLDGTANKSKLGANAILSVSQAVFELGAAVSNMPTFIYTAEKYGLVPSKLTHLPTPMFNLINGGQHGGGNLDFQEFLVIPSSRKSFSESLMIGSDIYHTLKKTLKEKNAISSVGDEGGFAPNLFSNTDGLELLVEGINSTSYKVGTDVYLGIDLAANSFFSNNKYSISDVKEPLEPEKMIDFLLDLNRKYSIFSLEDPLVDEAWNDWTSLTNTIGKQVMIIGDDLLATNKTRLKTAIEKQSCNSVIVKPNQIGTISETASFVKVAKENNMSVVVSHRSGETEEDFLADFAVGIGADFVKFGAPGRGERVTKYNRLLYIESYLQSQNV